MTDTSANIVQDANALLGRYQDENARTTTRAIVAEALLNEARSATQHAQLELAELRSRVAALEAERTDATASVEVMKRASGDLVEWPAADDPPEE